MNQTGLSKGVTAELRGEWCVREQGVGAAEVIFWDDDFMSEAWQWQRLMDDEIHPVNVCSQAWES